MNPARSIGSHAVKFDPLVLDYLPPGWRPLQHRWRHWSAVVACALRSPVIKQVSGALVC